MKKIMTFLMMVMLCAPTCGLCETFETAEPEMLIDLTYLIMAIVGILLGVLVYKLWPYLKTKLNDSQLKLLMAMADVFVYAAEQMLGAGNGEKKLEYVMEKLKQYGFKMDVEVIRAYVEAAVKNMNIRLGKA